MRQQARQLNRIALDRHLEELSGGADAQLSLKNMTRSKAAISNGYGLQSGWAAIAAILWVNRPTRGLPEDANATIRSRAGPRRNSRPSRQVKRTLQDIDILDGFVN